MYCPITEDGERNRTPSQVRSRSITEKPLFVPEGEKKKNNSGGIRGVDPNNILSTPDPSQSPYVFGSRSHGIIYDEFLPRMSTSHSSRRPTIHPKVREVVPTPVSHGRDHL